MDLIFWRHAEAEDEREGLADIDRPLTARGEKQAQRVGAWLDRHLPEGTASCAARRCAASRRPWRWGASSSCATSWPRTATPRSCWNSRSGRRPGIR